MTTTSYFNTEAAWCRSRAAAHLTAQQLLADDLAPGERANENHLLVDLHLRRLLTEHTAQILDFGRDQLVVLGKEADRCALEVAFRDGNELWCSLDLLDHHFGNEYMTANSPIDEPITVFACLPLRESEGRF